ncbi:MAG: hypothetical protein K8T90_19550 [Planctomycetes bacterium]|nr:hypothetical protein [Planctomycetota bacterium]
MTEREPLKKLLREACAAESDAESNDARIADAAWERAAEIRREGAAATAQRASVGGRVRRLAIPVAAAAALVATVLTVRSASPAFAVEGDDVQVLGGDGWQASRRVPLGSWVFVPTGAKSAVSGGGDTRIEPQPGALFRIVADALASRSWRVELRSGDAEVAGGAVKLKLSDTLEAARADAGESFHVVASFGGALGAPPLNVTDSVPAGFAPRIRAISGAARVSDLQGVDRLILKPRESAVRFTIGSGAGLRSHLIREAAWNADVPASMLRGDRIVGAFPGAGGDVAIAIESGSATIRAVRIPGEVRDEAMGLLNVVAGEAATIQIRLLSEFVAASPGAAVASEYECTAGPDGKRTRIVVRDDGTARLETTGDEPREFPTLAALRAAAPEAAALFGARLR